MIERRRKKKKTTSKENLVHFTRTITATKRTAIWQTANERKKGNARDVKHTHTKSSLTTNIIVNWNITSKTLRAFEWNSSGFGFNKLLPVLDGVALCLPLSINKFLAFRLILHYMHSYWNALYWCSATVRRLLLFSSLHASSIPTLCQLICILFCSRIIFSPSQNETPRRKHAVVCYSTKL